MNRDERIQALYEGVKPLNRDEFRTEIRKERDDHLLADLRPIFNWNPQDPSKSDWQVREINRLLTERKARRVAQQQWIGIGISNAIALAALIVSILK